MGENFTSAITQIEDLASKKKQINERAAALISEAILDRIRSGNLTRNSEKDIRNAIRQFSDEEQVEILTKALVLVGMNVKGARRVEVDDDDDNAYFNTGSAKKIKSRSDIFGRRFDD